MSQADQTPNLRPKKNGWEARAMVAGTRYSAYGATKQEAAERLEEKVLGCLPPDSRTFGSYLETGYLPSLEHKPSMKRQVNDLKAHFTFKDKPLEQIDRPLLQSFFNIKSRSSLSWWTVKHLHKIVHAALNLAEADGLISSNPARHVKLPPKPVMTQEILTAQELRKLIAAAVNKQSAALPAILLGGLLGLGFEEIRALTAADFHRGAKLTVRGTKTAYRVRDLPLPRVILEILQGYHFPLMPLSNSSAHSAINRVAAPLGFPAVGRHVLRHTCSTFPSPSDLERKASSFSVH